MIPRPLILILTLVLMVVFFAAVALGDAQTVNDIKNPKYMTLDGKTLDLKDYNGKVLLLNFWASWCMPCLMEIPSFNKIYDKYRPRGLEMLALNVDTDQGLTRIKDISKKARIQYKVGKAQKEMIGELKIFAIPTSYLFGKDGKLIRKYTGPPSPEQLKTDIEKALAK